MDSKVYSGLQSRCDCIQLLPPSTDDWAPRAQAWLAADGVSLPLSAVRQLINGVPDIRRIERTLEAFVVQSRLSSAPPLPVAPVPNASQPASPPPAAAPALTLVPGNALVTSSGLTSGSGPSLTVLPQLQPAGPSKQTP